MFVVQIEKADHTIQGAYQMINQQFVERNCNDVEYVNREEIWDSRVCARRKSPIIRSCAA